ncbi:MAG: hypothetical protein AAB405_01215 [Patescibacteria group bacterium]
MAEYQKMIEKGKADIAEKTLAKYQNQLNRALAKTEEIKQKGKDIKDLSQQIETAASKHLEVLRENLEKVPETAKKGIENAIENSKKGIERVLEVKMDKEEKDEDNEEQSEKEEVKSDNETSDWKTYRNEKYGFEVRYPGNQFSIRKSKDSVPPSIEKNIDGVELYQCIDNLCKEYDHIIGFYPMYKGYADISTKIYNNFSNNTVKINNFLINNINGIYINFGEGGTAWYNYFIPISKNQTLMIIRITNDYLGLEGRGFSNQEKDKIFNQILSTFKFINQ